MKRESRAQHSHTQIKTLSAMGAWMGFFVLLAIFIVTKCCTDEWGKEVLLFHRCPACLQEAAGISISLICRWLQSSTGCSWWGGSEGTLFCFKSACWFPLIVICSWVLLVQGLGHPSDRDLLSIPCVEVLEQVVFSYFTSSWCEMGLPADQAITDGRDLRRHLSTPQAGILSLGWHRGAYTHFSICEISPVE